MTASSFSPDNLLQDHIISFIPHNHVITSKLWTVSKFWNKRIEFWFYYIDSEAFDRAQFHTRAEKSKDLVKCKSNYHRSCVHEKVCAVCRESFRGGFHKFWGVHAHDECIRSLIKNDYYIKRDETEAFKEIQKLRNFPREPRTGLGATYGSPYSYYCVWMFRSALIPFEYTVQYVLELEHVAKIRKQRIAEEHAALRVKLDEQRKSLERREKIKEKRKRKLEKIISSKMTTQLEELRNEYTDEAISEALAYHVEHSASLTLKRMDETSFTEDFLQDIVFFACRHLIWSNKEVVESSLIKSNGE